MQLDHHPRITGLSSTTEKTKTKTTRVWENNNHDIITNDIVKKNNYCKHTIFCKFHESETSKNFTKFPVRSIRSLSIFTYNAKHKTNYDIHFNNTRSNRQRHKCFQRVHSAESINLYTISNDQKCFYHDYKQCFFLHVQIHSTAFDLEQSCCALQSYTRFKESQSFCIQGMDFQKNKKFRDSMPISHVFLLQKQFSKYQTTKVYNAFYTHTLTSIKMLGKITFNYHEESESVTKSDCIRRKISGLIGATEKSTDVDTGIDPIYKENRYEFSGNAATFFRCKPFTSTTPNKHKLKDRKNYRQCEQDEYNNTDNDNTPWSENYPNYLSKIMSNYKQSDKLHNKKCKNKKNNRLLLLFYFFALPLLCSTDPLFGLGTTGKFVRKSALVETDNFTSEYNNETDTHRLQNIAVNIYPQQQQLQKNKKDNVIHPYKAYNWEVNQINPWLSACDLAGPAPADLQGTCGPPESPKYCPLPCASNTMSEQMFRDVIQRLDVPIKWRTGSIATGQWKTKKKNTKISQSNTVMRLQCLHYLEESHKRDICEDNFGRHNLLSFSTSRENRYWFVSGLRLRHCCELPAINALAPGKGGPLEHVLNGGQKCIDALDKLLIVDALAARLHCEFQEVLARYDCGTPYSVIHNCTHCKEAYRKWVCSSLVPYFAHRGPLDSLTSAGAYVGLRLRPCLSFCQSVEKRCPYLLPGDRAPSYPTQYAGEPTFLCTDPNIPETGEQAIRGLHGNEEEECCFRVCAEDQPGSGVCSNCTELLPHGHRIGRDPATAPQCEISNYSPNYSTDNQKNKREDEIESFLSRSTNLQTSTMSPASICNSAGMNSILLSSSGNQNLPPVFILSIFVLWIWHMLISVCSA